MSATFFEYLGWVSLSPNLKESFNKTLQDAERHRHALVEIEHLLFSLVDDPEGAIALMQMGVDRDDLRDELADHLDTIATGSKIDLEDLQPARELKKLMAKASDQADNEHDDHIDGGDVIRALGEFISPNSPDFLKPLQQPKKAKQPPKRATRKRTRKNAKADVVPAEPVAPQTIEAPMDTTPPSDKTQPLNFDVDPIKASIKAIMARRADAEEILFECEWYHLFKSLNMIDDGLEGEEQTHRAKLLERAEMELAERPRCRKAFLYVRHLDQELERLKGIVDFDWADDFTPDQTVAELERLRSMPSDEKDISKSLNKRGKHETIGEHLLDVKIQESEVRALEQKLLRLDKTAGSRQNRLKELESHLETHDTHSKKRENVIGELERYLRSEMQMSDARDHRIVELEKELHDSKSISDSQVEKTGNLQNELAAFKEHAGNREMHIADLEAKLKAEKDGAVSHVEQVRELHAMLATEKSRAESHDQHVEKLQKTFEEEKIRSASHEQQVLTLEADLKSRLEQIQAREQHIKNLQENLSAKESDMAAREQQMKQLETDLSAHQNKGDEHKRELHSLANNHKSEVGKLLSNISDQEGAQRAHQDEIKTLRTQLGNLENQLVERESTYTAEKAMLSNTIEEMRQEIEESESLIEIIHATGEPYRVNSDVSNSDDALVQIVHRRTIPLAKPRNS